MRVNPEFALAVTFLTVAGEPDAQGNAAALPVGTAFLIGEPLGATGKRAPWLVTARHVIDNTTAHERLFFRVAKDDGTVVTMSAPHGHWVRHPSSDVAMVRIQLGFQTQQLKWIPLELLIDEVAEADGTIGIGDETFMLTVLPQHPGLERDRPITRFGHISKIATEPVQLSGGPNYPPATLAKAFLIEATTWPTNSGAPVFIHYSQRVEADESEARITIGQAAPRLLGLCAGHYGVPAAVKLGGDEGAIDLNSGISIVTPASAILEVTRRPEHVAWRDAEIARLTGSAEHGTFTSRRSRPYKPVTGLRLVGVSLATRSPRWLFGPVAVLCGVLWAVHGWIGTLDPRYWMPGTAVDYASVASFSAALIALGICIWHLRVVRSRAVAGGGAAAAFGLWIAGIANIGEDWFGISAFVVGYLPGVLIGTFALIPLGVGLAREARPRWMAAAPLITVPGLIFQSHWYGTAILTTTWIAAGVLHGLGRLPLTQERDRSQTEGVAASSEH